jgi:5-methylcytosine-specific restriction endonuclease McrA
MFRRAWGRIFFCKPALPMTTPCAHPVSVTCIRTIGGGGTQIVRQCKTCGAPTSSAIARSKFTSVELDAMPAYRDDAMEEYGRKQREAAQLAWDMESQDRKHAYALYLQSPEWQARRRLTLERDKYKCQGCLTAPATQVHHKNYDHRGDELLYDLVSLCRSCHEKTHNIVPQ